MDQQATVEDGIIFGLAKIENEMRKIYREGDEGVPLSNEQKDKLEQIRNMSQVDSDSIKELISEES